MSVVEAILGQLRFWEADGNPEQMGRFFSGLLEQPGTGYTQFVRLDYFRQCRGALQRMQEIPAEYLQVEPGAAKLFVSHKWDSPLHPDPDLGTIERLLGLTKDIDGGTGVWMDYCSMPQVRRSDGVDDRSDELKDFFRLQLSLIPLVILESQCLYLWGEEGVHSGWCTVELLIAQALRQHINRFVYERRQELLDPPLFAMRVGNETVIDSDLWRFKPPVLEKIFCDSVARARHDELVQWMNQVLFDGAPTPYSRILGAVTPQLLERMIDEHGLVFGHAPDREFVSGMLFKLYEHLSKSPFDSFRWSGKRNLLSMWHYVRGSLGNGLLPGQAYCF